MANSMSPLYGIRKTGHFGVAGPAGVTLSEISGFGLVQFAAWGATLAQTGAAAASAAGCATAPIPGQSRFGAETVLLRVEPLKWWMLSPPGAAHVTPNLAPDLGAVLDMQDARCWLRVGGARAETLLNQFLPLNLRSSAFAVGAVASTAFHHVGVTLWRDEDHFNLLIPRSSARSLWELLSDSAQQYGLAET